MSNNSILTEVLIRQENDKKRSRTEMQREIDQLRWDKLRLQSEIEVLILTPQCKTADKIRAKHLNRLNRKQILNDAVMKLSEETRSLLPIPLSFFKPVNA